MKPYDVPEDNPPSERCELETALLADEGDSARTSTERELFSRYPEWQLMNEKAEKKSVKSIRLKKTAFYLLEQR